MAPRIWKISNPLVRDIVRRHLAATKWRAGDRDTRCAFQSRQRQGLEAAVAGALLTSERLITPIAGLPMDPGPA